MGYSRSCGFPHSDIVGSKPVRSSPTLFAAYHVLHRLSMPRHPPNALLTLENLNPCARELGIPVAWIIGLLIVRYARSLRLSTKQPPRSDRVCASVLDVRVFAPVRRKPSAADSQIASRTLFPPTERLSSLHRRPVDIFTCPRTLNVLTNIDANLIARQLIRISCRTAPKLVEPDGVEPTTSCLQSRRSPN